MSKENFAVNPLRQSNTGQIKGQLAVNGDVQKSATKTVHVWNKNSDGISAGWNLRALYQNSKHK